jgi:hypothetical protein
MNDNKKTHFSFPPKSNQLAIHTVFLPRENILFIREWIAYHIRIGVSHFYLYNNKGSEGDLSYTFQSDTTNKYGMDYVTPTAHITDEELDSILEEVACYFKGYVTYVPWSKKDKTGKVVYAQNDSIKHYYNHFSMLHDWTAFIDIDEFIFSAKYDNLGHLLDECEQNDCFDIQMLQKKFADRFYDTTKYVIEITDCVENVDTRNWSPKHIIKNEFLDGDYLNGHKTGKRWGIHNIPNKSRNMFHAPMDVLRFNHYNTNKKLLNWMKNKTINKYSFSINGVDDGMKRYYDFINFHCNKKPRQYNYGKELNKKKGCNNNLEKQHLVFNEPLDVNNLFKPRFLLRMGKELINKLVRDLS